MPNKIEAVILLSVKKPGAYVVIDALKSMISNHPSFYSETRQQLLVQDLNLLLSQKESFPPEAMRFPVGRRVNISRHNYLNKSPILGLIAEYLALGEESFHRPLIELYIDLYFRISERFAYTDQDYKKWLDGKLDKILGIYQSSVETAARHLRNHLATNDSISSSRLLESFLGEIDEEAGEAVRSLKRLQIYCAGALPKAKSGFSTRRVKAHVVRDEYFDSYSLVDMQHEEAEVELKFIEQKIPKYINTQQDLLRQYNKINGRANQLNRQNQLRALDRNFIRPAVWARLDELFFDECIESSSRALICLSLIAGRSLESCYDNLNSLLRRKGYLSISLNVPEVSFNKFCLGVNNTLIVAIPNRYQALISSLTGNVSHDALKKSRTVVNAIDSALDVTPQKISRLFFFLANARSGKSYASLLFDSPLQTIATQLHYTITTKNILAKLYSDVFLEFESMLINQEGISVKNHPGLCGVENFPDPNEVRRSLISSGKNQSMLNGYLLYASENGSRGVLNQAVDFHAELNRRVLVAVVNDKKRNGAQHARPSFLQRKSIRKIYEKLDTPSMGPSDIFFEYIDKGKFKPLSPKYFSSAFSISFKMNAIRKMRRAFMLNMGVDEELIDSLNGHHYVGTVAVSPQSSLSLSIIYQSVMPYIDLFSTFVEGMTDVE